MKNIRRDFILLFNQFNSKNCRLIIAILTMALFVLSAGAPNATIGIGK
jgi:hypothetical protein